MTSRQMLAYVQQQLASGATEESIRQSLASAGWSEQSVHEVFSTVHGVSAPPAPKAPSAQEVLTDQPQTQSDTTDLSFQERYPLSVKRKFWKKFLPKTIVYGILILLPSIFVSVISAGTILLPIGLAGILLYLIGVALYAWYVKAYIRLYYYSDSDSFITIRKGVITPKEIHVQYLKVQDVYVDQDLLDRLLGLYDVHLASATATSGMEAHIDGVNADVAQRLKNALLSRVRGGEAGSEHFATQSTVNQAPAHFAQESQGDVSSKTYPIQTRWLVSKVLIVMAYALFIGVGISSSAAIGILTGTSFTLFYTIYILIWKKNYNFQFLPEYIVVHTSVISKSERHIPYSTVQDVNINQTILGRIFGFVNVKIENATQSAGKSNGVTIPGQTVTHANAITEALKSILLTKDSSHTGL